MATHNQRLRDISKFAAPPEGSDAHKQLAALNEANLKQPEFRKKVKESFEKAFAMATAQDENGAGLPLDKEIRHFLREFNDRNWKHGLRSMPSSFNVLEALFKYDPSIQFFELLEEENYLFNFYEFIDFITSSSFSEDSSLIKENLTEGLIYHFDISNNIEDITFSTIEDEQYAIAGVSLIREDNEVVVFLLAGLKADTEIETKNLRANFQPLASFKPNIKPADDLEIEAVRLLDDKNFWKTLAYCRVDLESLTINTRYIQYDLGNSYRTISDDITAYTDAEGKFLSQDIEKAFKESQKDIDKHQSIFEVAIKCLYLPYYFNINEDKITEQDYETEFGQANRRKALFKREKIVPTSLQIKTRAVFNLDTQSSSGQSTIQFNGSSFKVERTGAWKTIEYNSKGKDKKGNPIQGRTWVEITNTWFEQGNNDVIVNIANQQLPPSTNPNQGLIYIMRNASHDLDIFKIGLTTRDAETRAKELSRTTGAADKFLVAQKWDVADCNIAEKIIHHRLDTYRINDGREFFKIDYETAVKVIREVVENVNKQFTKSS